jgi:membrane-associated phospholipid phosphatase
MEGSRCPIAGSARAHAAVVVTGCSVLLVSGLLARGGVSEAERAVFQAVNELPGSLHPIVWPLMQYGTFITIPVLAVLAFCFRRFRLGIALLLAGVGVYLIALLVKSTVERQRPGGLLDGVEARESFAAESLGYPSGHASVAAALTVVAAAYLPRRWALAAAGVAIVVMFGRMYMGAHLPLDLIGGAALGAIAGGVVNLVVPPDAPSRASLE